MIDYSQKTANNGNNVKLETRTRAGYGSQLPKLPDRVCEFGLFILLWNGVSRCTHFRAILCFRGFAHFTRVEQK